MYFLSLFSDDADFCCNDPPVLLLLYSFYTSFPITAHHLAGSTVGIRGYIDFYSPYPASLYCYDNEERTHLISNDSDQTVWELVTNASFLGRDRNGLPTTFHIWGRDTKDSLLLPLCPWVY